MNIHFLFTSFYQPTKSRHKVLLESRAFPSDHYAIESQIRLQGFEPATSMICLEPKKVVWCFLLRKISYVFFQGRETLCTNDILDYIEQNGDSIAVIFFSGVQYYTGQLFDIQKITKAGHEKVSFIYEYVLIFKTFLGMYCGMGLGSCRNFLYKLWFFQHYSLSNFYLLNIFYLKR